MLSKKITIKHLYLLLWFLKDLVKYKYTIMIKNMNKAIKNTLTIETKGGTFS